MKATIVEKSHLWPTRYIIEDSEGKAKIVSKSKLYAFASKNNLKIILE